MAVDIDTIGIAADTKDLQRGKRDLDEFGRSADKASRQADDFGKKTKTGVDSASSSMLSFGKAAGVAYAAYSTFTRLASAADTYTKITAQLKIATKSQEEYNAALADVKRIASTAQADIESVNKLYVRLTGSLSELGVEQKRIADISETVALALKVEGAEASAVSSVMLQLSQGFASGVLRGDEFNSMAEGSQTLMKALAASMGVTTGALRDMASEGLITREVMLRAFGDSELLNNLRKQAEGTKTISGAIQELKNNVGIAIGSFDQATGASRLFADAIKFLSDAVKDLNDALSQNGASKFENIIRRSKELAEGRKIEAEMAGASPDITKNLKFNFGTIKDAANDMKAWNDERAKFTAANPFKDELAKADAYKTKIKEINDAENKRFIDATEALRLRAQVEAEFTKKSTSVKADNRAKEDAARYAKNLMELQEEIYVEDVRRNHEVLEQKSKDAKEAEDKIFKYKLDLEDKLNKEAERHYDVIQRSENKLAKERLDAAEKLAKKQEEAAKELNKSITDALMRGFESGKSFAQNFKETLINMFKTMVLRPAISFLIDSSGLTKVLGGLGGLFSGSASAGTSGLSSMFSSGGDIISTLKNGFSSVNDSFIEGIAGFGTKLREFGFDGIGTLIENNSTMLGNIAPWAGAAIQLAQGNVGGAVGTALGTAIGGPIGGAIGSFLGSAVGGLFGGSTPKRNWAQVTGTYKDDAFNVSSVFSKRGGSQALEPLTNLSETFSTQLGSLFKAFDLNSVINTIAAFSTRPGKKTNADFGGSVDGVGFGTYGIRYGKKDQEAWSKFVNTTLGEVTVQAIQASRLSSGVKKFFDGLTKKEDVSSTINTLASLNLALADLPPVFNAIRNAIETTDYTTAVASLQAQFQAVQVYTSLFYTEQENFATYTAQLTRQFSDLNIALPATRDAYRQLVDGIDVVDEATRDQFNSLVNLAPAMDMYYKQLQQQADGIDQVNQALADGLDRNLFSTYADYASARASVANGLGTNGFVGELSTKKAQGEADLVNAVKSLVAQQARTDQILAEIADATRRTREINERWNGDGLPETRVI